MVKVPESVLKKQATERKDAKVKAKAATAAAKQSEEDYKLSLDNAAKYAKEYAATEKAAIDSRRMAKKDGGFYVPPEPKLMLVIRIRGIIGVSPKAKKVMQLFRLRQIHNATFVKLNEATRRMLRLIEPYVTYGPPTRATIEKLIYKRGFIKLNNQRIPLATNEVLQDSPLGKEFGIRCTADLVHELVTVGPNFKQANNALWPFKLGNPTDGFSTKTKLLHFMEGGETGDRGEEINKLVKRML